MATGTSKWREGDLINVIEEVQDRGLSVKRTLVNMVFFT